MNYPAEVVHLQKLLGHDVLMLPWPLGKKGGALRWGHLTVAAMSDPGHLRKFKGGNIGIALGKVSNGLCSLDIDSDEEAEEFLRLNPVFGLTLRSRGSRGCNFWYKVIGPYPPLKLLKRHGRPWGEWRADGGQTIIHGLHPSGNRYRILNGVPPLPIRFDDIRWPEGIIPPLAALVDRNVTECTELTELTDVDGSGSRDSVAFEIRSVPEAVSLCLPNGPRQNHSCLFKLARAVKGLESQAGHKYAAVELRGVFGQWYERAASFLDASQSSDDYFMEFLEAYESARHGLGSDVLTQAWKRSGEKEAPEESKIFDDPGIRRLVGLCRELQILSSENPFFISCRKVQELFQLPSHVAAARRLKGLCAVGILEVVEQGGAGTNRATRYRYLGTV